MCLYQVLHIIIQRFLIPNVLIGLHCNHFLRILQLIIFIVSSIKYNNCYGNTQQSANFVDFRYYLEIAVYLEAFYQFFLDKNKLLLFKPFTVFYSINIVFFVSDTVAATSSSLKYYCLPEEKQNYVNSKCTIKLFNRSKIFYLIVITKTF